MQKILKLQPPSLSILTIDDSSSERALLSAKLHQLGHQVTEVSDCRQALACLSDKSTQIDMILLDVRMPGIDGFETARRIRALERKRAEEWRPIIFLSGLAVAETIAQGIEAGGDDYLTKPVDIILLQAKIMAMQRIATMRRILLATKQQLEVMAHTDELTQVPNRRHFHTILDSELSRARRHNTPLCIAYVDLDHFKWINDTHGHEAGDVVLQAVASVISTNLRSEDSIGRLGGEEFCLCLPNTDTKNSLEPCERYRSLIENLSIQTESVTLSVTASFGLTRFLAESDDSNHLLARADEALYRAKHLGRNRIEII